MTSILVLGSQGTIGHHLVHNLTEQGYDLTTSDVKHDNKSNHIKCDISKYRQVEKLFETENFDLVYNLAVEFGIINGEEYYEQVWLTNAVGMKNLLKIQEKKRFRLVHFSSSEIYGELATPDGFFKEEYSDKYPLKQSNDYGISKWVNELQIRNSISKHNTETMILRLSGVYGPGEYYTPYRSVVSIFVYHALHDIPYKVYLGYHRSFMYIDDLVHTLCAIIDKFKPSEIYNVSGEEYVEIKKVSDLILNYLGKDDSVVTYLEKDVHKTVDKRPDITKAKRELGHKLTVPLSEGIPRTIEWQKEVYNI